MNKKCTVLIGCFAALWMAACSGEDVAQSAHLTLSTKEIGATQLEVAVQVEGAQYLFGAALDLVYEPKDLTYVSWKAGGLMSSAGTTPIAAVALEDAKPGRLVAGIALADGGVVDQNTGQLFVFKFDRNLTSKNANQIPKICIAKPTLRAQGNTPIGVDVADAVSESNCVTAVTNDRGEGGGK